jgi:hypothetical protein
LKPAQAKQFMRPHLEKKKKSQKQAGGVAQSVDPEFKPQYCKNKTKQNKESLTGARGSCSKVATPP